MDTQMRQMERRFVSGGTFSDTQVSRLAVYSETFRAEHNSREGVRKETQLELLRNMTQAWADYDIGPPRYDETTVDANGTVCYWERDWRVESADQPSPGWRQVFATHGVCIVAQTILSCT